MNPEKVNAGFQSGALAKRDGHQRGKNNILCLCASNTGTFVRSSKHPVREAIVVTSDGEVAQTVPSYFPFLMSHLNCQRYPQNSETVAHTPIDQINHCELVRLIKSYLCTWHDREEVKGRGSLGPIGVHGDGCCGVLDKHRGCDGGWL